MHEKKVKKKCSTTKKSKFLKYKKKKVNSKYINFKQNKNLNSFAVLSFY